MIGTWIYHRGSGIDPLGQPQRLTLVASLPAKQAPTSSLWKTWAHFPYLENLFMQVKLHGLKTK